MSKASNFVLEHCIEKLCRINHADIALGFLVEDESTPSVIKPDSQVVIKSDILTPQQNNKLINSLMEHLFKEPCCLKPLFYHQEEQSTYIELFKNRAIQNFRYIPIMEGDTIYAVVVLINVEFSLTTKALINVEPFVLATIALLKNRKQHNNAYNTKLVDSTTKEKGQSIVESLLQNTFHPTFIFNDEFKILKANAASQRLFNSNIERGWLSINKLLHKAVPTISARLLNTISKYNFLGHLDRAEWLEVDFQNNSYQTIKVDIYLFAMKYGDNQCFGLMLNEKLQSEVTENNYYASLQRFNALTSVVPMAILQVDKQWNCSYVNQTWERYTGQLHDHTLENGWLSCLLEKDIKEKLPEVFRAISHAKSFQDEIELITLNKNKLWVSIHAVGLFNEKYEVTGLILTMNDISDARIQAEKLQKMASYDHLTGLSNRAFFNDRLSVALSRVNRHGITAVMFLDLDRFKQINDTLGHLVGDKVIQEVAKRLQATVRDEDSVARLGGDEFAIIFTDVKNDNILASIASKIVHSISLPLDIDNRALSLSCSIGVAISDSKNTTAVDILRKADLALYKAKNSGRNQFHFYDSKMEKDISILNCLRDSLNNLTRGDFSLVFQPQVDATTNEVIGFEVLSRWNSPTLGIIGPDVFIKIIEENNLINSFSNWLFHETILRIKSWKEENLLNDLHKIAINLSVKQLHLVEFADTLIALFNDEAVDPNGITLEVTETAFIQDPEIAGKNLHKLKDFGFSIALDDFGTGYSSLGLLRQMSLDYIKIDRSFIQDVLCDDEAEKIVLAIVGLANMLKLGVIAEGVENSATKKWLNMNNCAIHQGYYYHKPLVERDAKLLLHETKSINNVIELKQHTETT
jgi:diguanylate cyclase (GGDEF)-like protein/PAS domain S-box-containing protein